MPIYKNIFYKKRIYAKDARQNNYIFKLHYLYS